MKQKDDGFFSDVTEFDSRENTLKPVESHFVPMAREDFLNYPRLFLAEQETYVRRSQWIDETQKIVEPQVGLRELFFEIVRMIKMKFQKRSR